jgi:hypothetical protein
MGNGPWPTGDGRQATGNRRKALCLLLGLLTIPSADAAEVGWTEVTVRVYHNGVVTESDETQALRTAARILAAADVIPRWTHCHPGAPDASCAQPLGPDELSLRLTHTRRLVPQGRAVALGDAFLGARAATLATVYLERVDDLARRSHADASTLLGRAIAHELTHLLTGNGRHATTGLMRPIWLAAELTRERADDWSLDAANVTAIRARAGLARTIARR